MEDIVNKLYELKTNRRSYAFCVVTYTEGSSPRKAGSKMIVFEDGTSYGTIGGGTIEKRIIDECPAIIIKGKPVKRIYDLEEDLDMHCGGLMEVYIEPVNRTASLFIFGGGHIGKALAKYAPDMGFKVTVFDNRDGIKNSFDDNIDVVEGDYFESISKAPFDDDTYIVIITHKHLYDEDILVAVARKPHAYLGMIGSKVKIQSARNRFKEENLLTEDEINKVDMPIGIPFAAETPAEIAVSILAKLIDVKNIKLKNV